jgi:hypothetical protein
MTPLPNGWHAPSDEKPWDGLVKQIYKEVGNGHVLKGFQLQLLARRLDSDDAVFALHDGRVAEVHMTWRQDGPETNPRFPATAVFPNFEEWLVSARERVR